MSSKVKYSEISVKKVVYDHSTRLFPFSPRKEIDISLIERLKRSIAETGNWQPIVVRSGTLEGIAGNHRFLALLELAKEQNADIDELTIPAMLVKCDEGMAVTIALAENEFRENLTQWEMVRALIKSVEKKPKVAETVFDVDGETIEQLRLWDKELDYDVEYQARRRELQARLTREWVAVINSRLGAYPELRIRFLEQLRHPTWVQAQSLGELSRGITNALRTYGVRFEIGKTWNGVPTPNCLGNLMEYKNVHEKLSPPNPSLILSADGGVEGFCPYLRLFPEYISQFLPKLDGSETQPIIPGSKVYQYPLEDLKEGKEISGEKTAILDRIEACCIAPDVHQIGSCFQSQEARATITSKQLLDKHGLQAVFPSYIGNMIRVGQFCWKFPQREGEVCTPENCKHNHDNKPGIVALAKPGGAFELICIHEKCGQAAKDKLVDWEAKQVQETQQRQKEALESLRRLTIEQTLLAPDRKGIDWLNRAILNEIETLLVQEWDISTMFHIVYGWQAAMLDNIAKEISKPGLSREARQIFKERFNDLTENPTNASIQNIFKSLRTNIIHSDEDLCRWLACLVLVRMWRDNSTTIEQIEQASRKILTYI
ncbi:MAG: ParB N-terminal domain-containing protein [Anaerolineales bacterium]